ncbi:DUF4224 domain-containing protein [Marinobacter sp. W-8]|uniref:DUF4224 domain-containing protein n=1 Tax=Marinobacter sp. W-8 TaxID=3369658 RepID=UPI0037C9138C
MLILDQEELVKLTGKAKKLAQRKALRSMGVKFGERLDGTPVVTIDAVREFIGIGSAHGKIESVTFNWGGMQHGP